MIRLILLFSVLSFLGCKKAETQTIPSKPSEEFSNFWNQGKAELTRYEVQQARYGELHAAEAVIIFVTEDFRTDKHVKLENYTDEGKSRSVPILKMNLSSRFNTGVYTYSLLTSTFSPIDIRQYPHSLKVSTSVQEWCGHVYSQLNLAQDKYRIQSHSYFENEADEENKIDAAWLEDELWTRVRIDPESLPIGDIKMIPGTVYARLAHQAIAVQSAKASKTEWTSNQGPLVSYRVDYPSENRSFILNYKKNFPHEIISFETTYKDGFGDKAKILRTIGTRKNSIMLDYWSKNAEADSTYRKELGLE